MDKVTPDEIANISFYGNKKERSQVQVQKKTPSLEARNLFLEALTKSNTTPVALSLFSKYTPLFSPKDVPRTPRLPKSLMDIYSPENEHLDDIQLAELCKKTEESLAVTTDSIEYLEKCTKKQSNSTIWFDHRFGRVTASFAHNLVHTSQDKLVEYIRKQVCCRKVTKLNVPAVQWGRENEPRVFQLYANCNAHENASIANVGMYISKEHPWLSASPDGMVKCGCHGTSLLEIKCPYKWRFTGVEEAMDDPDFFVANGCLKKSHKYWTQVQIQMFVCGVKHCDMAILLKDLLVISIEFDPSYIQEIIPKLYNYWSKHILTEVLTRKIEKNTVEDPINTNMLYCFCKAVDNKDMVKCDGANCSVNNWVHLDCIRPKRKTKPTKTFYCRKCKSCKKKLAS